MAPISQAVMRMGKTRCELCNKRGTESNPLTRHHADGNNRNNELENLMVAHRILCHTFADFITQAYAQYRVAATPTIIKQAWKEFHWDGRAMVFGKEE